MPPRLQDGGFKIIYERNKHEKLEIVIANSVLFLVEKSLARINCLLACVSAKVKKTSIFREAMKLP